MSADEQVAAEDAPMQDAPANTRVRPKLDLTLAAGGGKERRRGKSMFGLLVGTLNKAKNEDKERNASEAAKKRQMIEQRLQAKLKKETDSVRRAEEAKKDKTHANRKEEELQLKDSIYKLRRTRLPLLANFLSTSDRIPSDIDTDADAPLPEPLSAPPRSHPPPLYYLPALFTPAQEAFLAKRKTQVKEAAESEWDAFTMERSAGLEEIQTLRQRAADEDARKRAEREAAKPAEPESAVEEKGADEEMPTPAEEKPRVEESGMDVDDDARKEDGVKTEAPALHADDEEAVEY